jgi:2-methylisocitrate lyase-like PEP mutase family enzyme
MTHSTTDRKTARLRQVIQRPGLTLFPSAYDCISARIMEEAGFEVLSLSGAGLAGSRLGLPDLGFLSFSDMLDAGARVAACVEIPLVVDGDTGYGNALNVIRAVREFERAGVAGVHFEDQEFPKKCGHIAGKAVIPSEEFVEKIRAAAEARTDRDFIIIARTDAIAVTGLADAIERGNRSAAAGADVVFLEAPTSIEDVTTIAREVKAPLLYNLATGGKSPALAARQLEDLGYKLAVVPTLGMGPAVHAMRAAAKTARETGSDAHVAAMGFSPAAFFELLGIADWRRLESRYVVRREP